MKKILFLCLLVSGCASFQTKQPSAMVGNHPFVLTSAYTGPTGLVNVYTSQDLPGAELTLSRSTTGDPSAMPMALEMTKQLFQAVGMTEDQYAVSSEQKDGRFSSSVDVIGNKGPGRQYSLSLSREGKNQQTTTASFKTLVDDSETREGAYARFLPDVQKFMTQPLYNTRPGHKKQDDSPDLQKLKTFLAAPYQPKTHVTRRGNITSYNSEDANEVQAFYLISSSQEPDVAAWLEKHIADYSPKFLYAMMIRSARNQEPPEKTIFWMTAAHFRAGSDAALCKDRFVSQYLTVMSMEFIPQIQPFISQEQWKPLTDDPKAIDKIFQQVIDWDKKHPQKNSPQWFCASGHAVSTSEAYPQKEWKKRRKHYRKTIQENRRKNASKNVQ